jgi:glycosyltransferase involved in cell wall biosynthesis
MPDGRPWPRITIVTPSFNQGVYLEETIRSVLLQRYPNLEYHVIDGGSTDGSVAIMRKYERWLTSWVSERDSGQSEAINKGFNCASGEIFNWLCSDDLFAPGALASVAHAFAANPTAGAVVGSCRCQYDDAPEKDHTAASSIDLVQRAPYGFAIWQPSCFFRRSLIARPFVVREDLHYCMDRELWCYLQSRQTQWHGLDETLSINRFTGDNKSLVGKRKIIGELDTLYRTYGGRRAPLSFWLRKVWLPLALAHARHPSRFVRASSLPSSRAVTLLLRLIFSTQPVQILQKEYYRYAI